MVGCIPLVVFMITTKVFTSLRAQLYTIFLKKSRKFYFIASATTSATPLSSGFGKISSTLGFLIYPAIASAALIFISSVICFFPYFKTPLKIPGNARTLLTWFG